MASEPFTYLDYNATAPVQPKVAEALAAALTLVGNPSSVHRYGRAARKALDDARERVAAMAGARPEQVVFTSGGTEANLLALRGAHRPRCLVSAIEHESVLSALPDVAVIPVTADGIVDLRALDSALGADPRPALVSVMAANNETGVVQPIRDVVALARRHQALVHCDAVQAFGRVGFSFAASGVDLMTLSAHKIGGPQGVGALIIGDGVDFVPQTVGGGQERRRRAGTENVAAVIGFGVAAELEPVSRQAMVRIGGLRDRLEAEVTMIAPDAPIHGAGAERLANTSYIGMPGVAAETQVIAFDLAGIAVSAGSACSSGKVAASHVLTAMGLDPASAGQAVRYSLGPDTTEQDIDRAVAAWAALYHRRRGNAAATPESTRSTRSSPATATRTAA